MALKTITVTLTAAEARALIRARDTHRQVLTTARMVQGIAPLDRGARKLQEALEGA